MNQFVQIPCGKCSTTVWISPAAGVGYCPQCHTPNQLPPGAAQAAQAPGAPAYGASPQAAPGAYGAPPAPGYGAPQAQGYGGPQAQGYGGAPQAPAGFGAPQAPGGFGPPQTAAGYGAPADAGAAYVPPAAPAPYAGAVQAPAGFTGMPMKTPGLPVGKIIGAIGGAILVGGLSIGGYFVKDMLKGGKKSLSSLGIDSKKADPDKMISATAPLARSWHSDAVFHSINVLGLESSGFVDLTKSGSVVTVEYFSPSRASSPVKKLREDAIKKFVFHSDDVTYRDRWDATNQWSAGATPIGGCQIKQLGPLLAAKGLSAGKFAHVSYDPTFSVGGQTLLHAMSDDPHLDVRFDPNTCAVK